MTMVTQYIAAHKTIVIEAVILHKKKLSYSKRNRFRSYKSCLIIFSVTPVSKKRENPVLIIAHLIHKTKNKEKANVYGGRSR